MGIGGIIFVVLLITCGSEQSKITIFHSTFWWEYFIAGILILVRIIIFLLGLFNKIVLNKNENTIYRESGTIICKKIVFKENLNNIVKAKTTKIKKENGESIYYEYKLAIVLNSGITHKLFTASKLIKAREVCQLINNFISLKVDDTDSEVKSDEPAFTLETRLKFPQK